MQVGNLATIASWPSLGSLGLALAQEFEGNPTHSQLKNRNTASALQRWGRGGRTIKATGFVQETLMAGSSRTNDIVRQGPKTTRGVKAFPAFDPHKAIAIEEVRVACSSTEDQPLEATFYIGKVRVLQRIATPDNSMIVLWYWPKMPQESTNAIGQWHKWYANWETWSWEPSKEDNDNNLVSTANDCMTNPSGWCTPMCTIHGIHAGKIQITGGEVYHRRPT